MRNNGLLAEGCTSIPQITNEIELELLNPNRSAEFGVIDARNRNRAPFVIQISAMFLSGEDLHIDPSSSSDSSLTAAQVPLVNICLPHRW